MAMKLETNNLLAQIRDYQAQIADSRAINSTNTEIYGTSRQGNFGSEISTAITQALSGVNELQANAVNLSSSYLAGDDIPLTDVVLEMQKSSLAFEATLQVRNKVLEAYQQIMNMPV